MNYAKELERKFKNNELKTLGMNDEFEFSCKQCGNCCHDRNDIMLNPYTVYKISKFLNMRSKNFIDKYCNVYIGSDSKFPMITVKFKQINIFGKKHTVCPFLSREKEGKARCKVHEVKPFVCAIYPLGRISKGSLTKDDTKYSYFVQEVGCAASVDAKPQIVKDWLDEFKVQDYIEHSTMYHEFIANAYEILDFRKFHNNTVITQKTKEMVYSHFIGTLYVELEKIKDTEKGLKERYKIALDMLGLLKMGIDKFNIDF